MENSIEEDENVGVLKFDVDMTVDTFLDQYIVWRLTDILRYESDPRVRRACHELKAYMKTPEIPND
jgi:hypothetical protein